MPSQTETKERLGGWSTVLKADRNIDRRTCHRIVLMQVLSLGAPRTGTLSMQEALGILGYANPYHFANVLCNAKDSDMWLDALDAKYNPRSTKKPFGKREFDQLLGENSAIMDVPAIMFWRELMEAYPDAKIVLVGRNEESWLRSIRGLADGVLNPLGRYVLRYTDPATSGRVLNLGFTWLRYFFGVEGPLTVESVVARAPETYRAHYREIRKTVPPHKLLEYKLGTDWEPLCKFLGKDIPNVPFPHQNDATALELGFTVFFKRALVTSARNIAVALGISALLYVMMRRQ